MDFIKETRTHTFIYTYMYKHAWGFNGYRQRKETRRHEFTTCKIMFAYAILLYTYISIHAEINIYMLDTYRRNEQQTQEDFFNKVYLPLTLYVRFERVAWGFTVRGSWRSNITAIFWPQSYGRQRCVFLVLQGCSTGGPGPTLLVDGFLYCILSASSLDPNPSGPKCPLRPDVAFPYHISSPTVCNSTGSSNSTELYNRSTPTRSLKSNV